MSDELIKRVESAKGPDREVDCLIHVTLFKWRLARVGADVVGENDCEIYTENGKLIEGFAYPPKGKISPYYHVPDARYTASIDAAVGLCERVLGRRHDWQITRLSLMVGGQQCAARVYAVDGGFHDSQESIGATPALALVLAILRANPEGARGG